jgi:hypothetical protein
MDQATAGDIVSRTVDAHEAFRVCGYGCGASGANQTDDPVIELLVGIASSLRSSQ